MTRSLRACCGVALLPVVLGGLSLRAEAPVRWGLQVGLGLAASNDLKVTTGIGPTLGFGVFGDWQFRERQALRGRVEFSFFGEGTQVNEAPGLHQELTTTVKNASLGAEYVFRPAWQGGRWSVGGGLYLIRWTVDGSNHLVTPVGTFTPSGSTTWTRQGLGVLAGYRWTERADLEVRVVASHYGQENQPTCVASLNLLLHF